MISDREERWWMSASARLKKHHLAFLIAFLFALACFYLNSIDMKLYADDFHSWNTVAKSAGRPVSELLLKTYNPEFYRPLEFLLIRANIQILGRYPAFYHTATILGHLLLCLAVMALATRLGFSRPVGAGAAVFFGIHNTGAMAVMSNDAASMVWSTFFGVLCLVMLIPREGALRLRDAALAALFLALSMLWKDSGTSYALSALFLLALSAASPGNRRSAVAPFLLICAAAGFYLALRAQAGVAKPVFGHVSRYEIWFGANLIKNPLLMLFSMLSPIGSSIIVIRLHNTLFMLLAGSLVLVVATGLTAGLVHLWRKVPEYRRGFAVALGLLAIAFLPDVLMTRVSELYTYKPVAVFAIFIAAGVAGLHRLSVERKRFVLFLFTATLAAGLIACNLVSVVHKERRMRSNGDMTWNILRQIADQVPEIGDHTAAVLANAEPGPAPLYSIYYMEGIHVLGGKHALEYIYGETIRNYLVVEPDALDRTCATMRKDCLTVLYRRGVVTARYRPRRFD